MRNTILIAALLFLHLSGFGQSIFYVIDDPDGYTNLRDGNKKIVGKLYDKDIFAYINDYPQQSSYLNIWAMWDISNTFTRYGWKEEAQEETTDSDLYIHQSRAKSLDKLPQLNKNLVNEDKSIFYNDKITIEIIARKIDPSKRQTTFDQGRHNFPTKIDGYKTHGIDWPLRDIDTEIESISYIIDGKPKVFEPEHIRGFLNISHEYFSVAIGKNNTYYLYGSGGDGSGGYEALWIIRDGEVVAAIASKRQVV